MRWKLMPMIYLESRKEMDDVEISDQRYAEIQIVTEEDELIASISDEDVILKDGYKIVCVPAAN